MEQWYLAAKKADFNALGKQLAVSPVLVRLMRNRDLMTAEEMEKYLRGSLNDLYDPHLLKDVDKGASVIAKKIREKKRIRIISDYDVDGVSSNYVLYTGLKRCGALVDYRIPDRIEDGYGINEHLITQAVEEGIDTILTCDNGIAAKEQIAYGNERGITFVITDHHDVPYEETECGRKEMIPQAAAVIDPKQEACHYPVSTICGAVVAWKFIQVLYEHFGISREETMPFLEIVALATVCDVMPLQDENRIIVRAGLRQLNHTKNPGLQALINGNNLNGKTITAYHLGFVLGPCINASGRLSTAAQALELLLCEKEERCTQLAQHLIALNTERKEMTRRGEEEAICYLEESGRVNDKVLVVYLPDCHESIAGIIAGRIRERYHKPVFVLTRTKEGIKGSGRSIEAYHMFREMTRVKECFDKFGGHPMAAGLSMQEDRVEELREKLNQNTTLTEQDFVEKVHIDIAIPFSYLDESFLQKLSALEPFGNGNEKPLFAQKNLDIEGMRELGNTGRCLKIFLKDAQGCRMEAMYFGEVEDFFQEMEAIVGKEERERAQKGLSHQIQMDCTYYPEINEWRGEKRMQIIIKNYRFRYQK